MHLDPQQQQQRGRAYIRRHRINDDAEEIFSRARDAISAKLGEDEVPRYLQNRMAEFFMSPLLYNRYLDDEDTEPQQDIAQVIHHILTSRAGTTFHKVLDTSGAIASMKDRHKHLLLKGLDMDFTNPRPFRLCAVFHSNVPSHYYMLGTLLNVGHTTPLGNSYTGTRYANMVLNKHFHKLRHDVDSMGLIPREILKKLSNFLSLHPQNFEINYQITTLDLNMSMNMGQMEQDHAFAFALVMDLPMRYLVSARNTIVELMHAAFAGELGRFLSYEVYAYEINPDLIKWMIDENHLVLHQE